MKRVWKTRDGQVLRIRSMGTTHINNCILMLQRFQERKILSVMLSGAGLQGEMARDAFDEMFDQLLNEGFPEDDPVQEYIDSFARELVRRGCEIPNCYDFPGSDAKARAVSRPAHERC